MGRISRGAHPPQKVLLLDVFLYSLVRYGHGRDCIDVGTGIHSYEFRVRIGNEGCDHAVLDATDSDSLWPLGSSRVSIVGNVDHPLLVEKNVARAAELWPLFKELSVLIEDLYAVVHTVGHEDSASRVQGNGMRFAKFAWASPFFPPSEEEFAVRRKFHNPIITILAMPVRDENVAIRSDHHSGRTIESVGPIACDAGLAQRHQHFPLGTELHHLMALPIFSVGVGYPHVVVLIDKKPVRKHEHFRAKALEQTARWIELQNRRFGPIETGISSAAFNNPYVSLAVGRYSG